MGGLVIKKSTKASIMKNIIFRKPLMLISTVVLITTKSFQQSAVNNIFFYAGFSFQSPEGWIKKGNDGVYEFSKTDLKTTIDVQPHLFITRDDMIAEIRPVTDINTGTVLRVTYNYYGTTGLYVKYEGTSNHVSIIIHSINLFSSYGVGITISTTSPSTINSNPYFEIIKKTASTVKFHSPQSSPTAVLWKKSISGRQLLYLKTETGIGSGSYEKNSYDLCSNGNFIWQYEDSYSSRNTNSDFSGGINNNSSGTWNIYTLDNKAILLFTYSNGNLAMKMLKKGAYSNEVFIDEIKYYITNIENCK
jgi:hypothetical protein